MINEIINRITETINRITEIRNMMKFIEIRFNLYYISQITYIRDYIYIILQILYRD